MNTNELVKAGKAYERLLASPDYKYLAQHLRSRIQVVSTQILQGQFDEFPKDYWVLTGKLMGLADGEAHMTALIKAMTDMKKEESRGKE